MKSIDNIACRVRKSIDSIANAEKFIKIHLLEKLGWK